MAKMSTEQLNSPSERKTDSAQIVQYIESYKSLGADTLFAIKKRGILRLPLAQE